jgi:hypothetical protein
METEKKQWTKPELIVLVRSKPEEAVLTTCKGGTAGPAADDFACREGGFCNGCLSLFSAP